MSVNSLKFNPFSFGEIVTEQDYCPRKDEEETIESLLRGGQKVALSGERRMGKTSLALHILEKKLASAYVHVDFMGIRDEREAASRILQGVADIKKKSFKWEEAIKTLGRFRPKVDIDREGRPTMTFHIEKEEVDQSLHVAFSSLKKFSKKNVVIFFDEFQDLKRIDEERRMVSLLRSKIQTFSRIPFLFVGSYRNKMDAIFKDPDSPFYNGATVIEIGTIDFEDFYLFIKKKMEKKSLQLSKDMFSKIYHGVYGISGDIQRFFRTAYAMMARGTELSEEIFDRILKEIFHYEKATYEDILFGQRLTMLQRNTLVETAKGEKVLYGKEFMRRIGVGNTNEVTQSFTALEKKNILYKYGKEYRFYNPFLREWIKRELSF